MVRRSPWSSISPSIRRLRGGGDDFKAFLLSGPDLDLLGIDRPTVAYHVRNRWMVDRSDLTLGFLRGDDPSSATWYTLDYTAALGKPRLVVPI
jgi:hypothetical protein